jgi:hypothetical protein
MRVPWEAGRLGRQQSSPEVHCFKLASANTESSVVIGAAMRKGGGWLPVRPVVVERVREARRAFRLRRSVERGGGGRAVGVVGVERAGVADEGRYGPWVGWIEQ